MAEAPMQQDGINLASTSVGLTSVQKGTAGDVGISCTVTHSTSQFATASFSSACNGLSGGLNAETSTAPAYSYSIATSSGGTGYAANGNVLNATDSVTGTWSYGYDYLNRLTSAAGSAGTFNDTIGVSGVTIDWQYDSFGNRTFQTASTVNLPSEWAQYTPASNRLVSTNLAIGSMQYDAAGDVLFDGINSYAYDAEGRVCATSNGTTYTGYIYDADGNRVAKGSVNLSTPTTASPYGLSCNLAINPTTGLPTNGFTLTKSYIRGTGGELLTEMGAGGQWVYSDAYAEGQLRATYNQDGNTYFALNDWLGTKRAELSAAGCLETFGSLPFGDDLTPLGNCPDASEQHFTGKERDTESGLDYFGARYYASSMGRFMSPDWSAKEDPVPYAKLDDPQSLNLYSYVYNNPLSRNDPEGHCPWCVSALIGAATGAGVQVAVNYITGRPLGEHVLREAVVGGVLGVTGFGLGKAIEGGVVALKAARAAQIASTATEALQIAHSTEAFAEGARLLSRSTMSAAEIANGGVGLARELSAAEQLGGFVARNSAGQDLVVRGAGVAARVDVVGNDFLAQVGGAAKNANPSAFGTQINNLVKAATANNMRAVYAYAEGTSQQILDIASKAGAQIVKLH
jgi:RHS repeat-associated protein